MIIDIHGHYTTAPKALQDYRNAQLASLGSGGPPPEPPVISDDELRSSIEENQLSVMRRRGVDVTLIGPRASSMGNDAPDGPTATAWARTSNDLVARISAMFPENFAPVAQLPQTPQGNLDAVVDELYRSADAGFVGCLLNPDPSGAHWTAPPLTDSFWFPVYDALVDTDMPAIIHVSTSCNPAAHTLGAHYLNADTTVFMQLMSVNLFERYPNLQFVIPHGGGAVPYHWGRYRGLAVREDRPDPGALLSNVFFDTCVYHQPGIDLLTTVIPAENLLFASEMLGAVRGADPSTGVEWDDTLHYLRHAPLSPPSLEAILSANAINVFPRLRERAQSAAREGSSRAD